LGDGVFDGGDGIYPRGGLDDAGVYGVLGSPVGTGTALDRGDSAREGTNDAGNSELAGGEILLDAGVLEGDAGY